MCQSAQPSLKLKVDVAKVRNSPRKGRWTLLSKCVTVVDNEDGCCQRVSLSPNCEVDVAKMYNAVENQGGRFQMRLNAKVDVAKVCNCRST